MSESGSVVARRCRPSTRLLVDLALVAVVGAIEVGITAIAAGHQDYGDVGIAGALLLLLGVGALPFRHRHPVGVLFFVLATTLAYWSLGYPRGPIFLALLIVFGQTVLTGHRRAAIVCLVTGYVGFLWLGYVVGRADAPGWPDMAALAAWLISLLCVTELVRSRRDRTCEAAGMRIEEMRRRTTDERLQMARELHDAVAHNMSLINIQAGVALHLMDEEPERARDALTTIKGASKEALVELRSILGVLRQVDEDAPRGPTPSLERIDDLVETAAASGIDVVVDIEGDLDHLPRNTDLAAFRIIQESLTNVARHSGVPEAVVRIRATDETLGLEILDEGTAGGVPSEIPGGGNGIPGMQERAASVGGRLVAGPRPGRGFAVRAELPARGRDVIRVLLVDDQVLVRGGLRALLDAEPDIDIVGEAGEGAEAVRLASDLAPDVVLMDIRMPGIDGLEATRQIVADPTLGAVRIVILTTFDLDEYVFEAIKVGAAGFMVKDTEPVDLIRAVRTVAAGDGLLSPRATRRLVEEYATRAKPAELAPDLDRLTEREREVMSHAAAGLSNGEIAALLVISPTTAKTHISRAMTKLGARDRAQLVVFAYETGLVRPGWLD